MKKNNLILIELNEINFDIVKKYLNLYPDKFTTLHKLENLNKVCTTSEEIYENLEPWIQWTSVHTGKTFDEHKVFRLGDISNSNNLQIFETLEQRGYSIGCVSPMNVRNSLNSPLYFIPDPWTITPSDNSWWSKKISNAISESVNDNSKNKFKVKNLIILMIAILRFAQFKNYFQYFKLFIQSFYGKWRKAIFLDLFLHDLHLLLYKKKSPNFSTIFFNAGAHIQHHYFFNSLVLKKELALENPNWYVGKNQDPLYELLIKYDSIIKDYLELKNTEIIIATGLSQIPYDTIKFYYRLKNHKSFLQSWNIKLKTVQTLMTRDFIIEFESSTDALNAQEILKSLKIDDKVPMFNVIDNRGKSIFITFSYPKEINSNTIYGNDEKKKSLYQEVAFVAIKNGMHNGKGYVYHTKLTSEFKLENNSHVKNLNFMIDKYFN